MLGQGETDQPSDFFIVRLRTTDQSENGKPSLDSRPGTLTTALTHVVYTRDEFGTAQLYLNGMSRHPAQ